MDASARQPLTHRDRLRVVLGVLLPVFMGSLDQTILAGALPAIGREFQDMQSLPWLMTAFLIASTAVIPLYGKISDIHGRRFTLILALSSYMAGSLVCALAPNMLVLIAGRVLHGLGSGGLSAMGMVVLGDVAAPKDRGRYYGYFALTYTSAGVCGPALGGFLADHLHWSVIFWMNIPFGLLAMGFVLGLLRLLPRHDRPHRLDILGAVLIVAASVPFMLALTMGGGRYAWTSPIILGLCAVALVLGIGFVLRLATASEPLIPLTVLGDSVARCAILANAFGWGAIIGLNIFLPTYLQTVMGLSATQAGLSLMILMATLNIGAGLSGQLLGRMRRYKLVPMLGLLLATGSVLLLGLWADQLTPLWFQLLLALLGFGFGPTPPLSSVALQNAVPPHQFGTAVGTMNFSRNLYATMLVAVFGAIVLASLPGAGLPAGGLPVASGEAAAGFSRVFFIAAASMAVALVCLVLLKERPLQTRNVPDEQPAPR